MLTRIKNLMGGRMLKDIRGTVFIALAGRLCHFVAFIYAADCLGDAFGASSEALGWAQYLQFILTLGLDIIAVRHLAARSISFERLVAGVFTARLIIYGGVSIVWILGLLWMGLPWNGFQLWLAAALNLFALGMNFQWVFQGKQRMPLFTFVQALISFCILISFLTFFKPGDSPEFEKDSIQSWVTVTESLKTPSDQAGEWLVDHLSEKSKQSLNSIESIEQANKDVQSEILQMLNELIHQELIVDTSTFSEIDLRNETRSLLNQENSDYEKRRLNRMLLEDAFPGSFVPMRSGTRVGSDLWVMGICQLIASIVAWFYIRRFYRVSLISRKWMSELVDYIKEGLPNWVFGLLYNTLITVGMLTLRKLSIGESKFVHQDAAYGTLYRLSLAVHFILAFVGSVIYTRIVVWKNERPDFFFRVGLVCGGVMMVGILVCSMVHYIHPWLYPILFKREVFLPAAPYMSWMIMGRFIGLSSGILVWGMLAHMKDWNAVICALVPVAVSVGLHFYLVPIYGMKAAVFLNFGGELGLFIFCLFGFLLLRSSAQKSNI